MSFYKKYELERLIADGEAKTFRAIETATGRRVLLHLFNPTGLRLLAVIKAKLASVPGRPQPPLIEIGEFAGAQYAVTTWLEPFPSLREWVALNLDTSDPMLAEPSSLLAPKETTPVPPLVSETPAPPPPPLVTGTPAPPAATPGSFTSLLDAPPAPKPPAAAEPATSPALLKEQLGEFSRLFEAPLGMLAPEAPILPSNPPQRAPGLLAKEPSEFSRLFASSPDAPPAAAGNSPLPDQRGTFRSMLNPAAIPERPAAPASQGHPREPQGLLDDQAGEFTRLFDAPKTPKPSPSAAPAGEFTRLFETGAKPAARTSLPPAAPPPPQPPQASPQAQPGEFTRLFEAPAGASQPAPAPPPPLLDSRRAAPPPPPATAPADSPWPSSPSTSSDSGQFTRLFGSRMTGESIDIEKEQASAAQSAPPENKPFQQAGEFTRMFGPGTGSFETHPAASSAPPSLNTSAGSRSRAGSASGMFGAPQDLAKYAAQTLNTSKTAPAAGTDAAPGEYTKMFGSPGKPPEPAPAEQPAAPKQVNTEMDLPKKSKRNLIIIAVVAGAFVLAIILIILLTRH